MHYMPPDHPASSGHPLRLFKLSDLTYTYPDGTRALNGISLDINQQDRVALVGRNGSGKSTLIRHLNGILPVQKGDLLYQGEPLSHKRTAELRLHVGILFQDPDSQLFCNTLYDDVAFGPMNQRKDRDEVDNLVRTCLSTVGLEPLMHKPAHRLSYGQKKRAAFASVLAMQPDVLILDEPTANLDPRQEKIFMDILIEFPGTLIIIDHDLLFLYEICDRAVVLSDGHIHHDVSMDELIRHQEALREHGLDFTFRFTCCGHHHPDSHNHHHHHHHHTHAHTGETMHLQPDESSPVPVLELQHYTFTYPDNSRGITDINLSINQGESLALIGENGAGKSTLASCLIGLNQGEGYLLCHGRQVTKKERRTLWQRVGMVFQNAADQLFCPSCWEEVAFGPQQMKLPKLEVEQRVKEALQHVRLIGYENRVPLNMSGGERKRLAIAAALAMQPEILILDEPTPSLDPRNEAILMEVLAALPVTKVLITHDLFFIRRLTQRTLVLHQGRIVRDYATDDFIADDHLQVINGLDYTYKNACFQKIHDMQHSGNTDSL